MHIIFIIGIVVGIYLAGILVLLGIDRFEAGKTDMEAAVKVFAWWPIILVFVCLAFIHEVVSGDMSWRDRY